MKSKKNTKRNHRGKSPSRSKQQKTLDPTNLREKILEAMKTPKRMGFSVRTIMRELNLQNKQAKMQVSMVVEELLEEGEIYLTEDGRYKSEGEETDLVQGVIDHVNQRVAFALVKGYEVDVRIEASDLMGAMDGDTVELDVYEAHDGKYPEGIVRNIVSRGREIIVGTIKLSKDFAFLIPDSKKIHTDIYIHKSKLKGAKDDQKALVKITDYGGEDKKPEGVVTEVLGNAGEHNTEMHAIMAEFDLPYEFPDNVIQAAKRIPAEITQEEVDKRWDMRSVSTFTIDPVNAKDFDDALSVQKLPSGNWEIGVHIADVTHYVKPNTLLEKEAFKRATSVYLVDRVVPMLPERLSNELCSLRPHEDKLTFSAVFELDEHANIVKEWFGRTVIHSDRRFAYEEAQEVLDTQQGDYVEEITQLNRLAYKLRDKRFAQGAISFETMEVRFVLDEEGKPLKVVPKVRQDAHKLIEEFMLLANKQVATFVYNLKKKAPRKTMVYRIHDAPDAEKLQTFATFVRTFGYNIATKGNKMSQSFNQMTDEIEGKPEQNFLQNLAIRTMSKAKYTTEEKGHFGLAFEHYSHFTSPIRRYPDMMAHRLLQRYLDGKNSVNKEDFEEKCEHSSSREKRAADAERASIKYKQVEFMQMMEDKEMEGIVTGVTDFGIYVEVVETKCEGMVRMSDIGGDYFELDPKNYRAIGRKTGKIIAFGDKVNVIIKDTSLAKRTIDLLLKDMMPDENTPKSSQRSSSRSSNKKTEKSKGKSNNNSRGGKSKKKRPRRR